MMDSETQVKGDEAQSTPQQSYNGEFQSYSVKVQPEVWKVLATGGRSFHIRKVWPLMIRKWNQGSKSLQLGGGSYH